MTQLQQTPHRKQQQHAIKRASSRQALSRRKSASLRVISAPTKIKIIPSAPKREKSPVQESRVQDVLKLWLEPPTFLFCAVVLVGLYIALMHPTEDINLLFALLVCTALYTGIGVKELITAIDTWKSGSTSRK